MLTYRRHASFISAAAPSCVRCQVGAVDSDERRQAGDVGILQNDVGQGLLVLRHRGEGDALRSVGNAQDHARVLNREEPLGHDHVQVQRQDQGTCGDQQSRCLMPQHKLQGAAVKIDDPVIEVLGTPVEAAFLRGVPRFEQFGAHHRRQAQRDCRRHQDSHRQSHGKLAEQPAYDIAHEQKRNQHCDQRHRQRDDCEPDLSRPFQGGLQRGFSLFQEARDVLDHHNGVVDHEACRNG